MILVLTKLLPWMKYVNILQWILLILGKCLPAVILHPVKKLLFKKPAQLVNGPQILCAAILLILLISLTDVKIMKFVVMIQELMPETVIILVLMLMELLLMTALLLMTTLLLVLVMRMILLLVMRIKLVMHVMLNQEHTRTPLMINVIHALLMQMVIFVLPVLDL